jgi:hypothetical protein
MEGGGRDGLDGGPESAGLLLRRVKQGRSARPPPKKGGGQNGERGG